MPNLYVVVDQMDDWSPYYTAEQVITSHDYLSNMDYRRSNCQVYNLCSEFTYRSLGYYSSLLAEARGQGVMPSVRTINQLAAGSSLKLNVDVVLKAQMYLKGELDVQSDPVYKIKIYFGETPKTELQKLARKIFESYPAPILEVEFDGALNWQIKQVRLVGLTELTDREQDDFSSSLDNFSRKIWRKRSSKPLTRYDLAILVDPEETIPPSNKGALQQFVRQAKKLEIDVDFITPDQKGRLLEYDALFIRQTTSVNHPTFHFAQLADSHHMPVIDDPDSIIKCTNKVFLHELLTSHRIQMPNSRMLFNHTPIIYDEIVDELGLPIVLKIPDGSSSYGVVKAENREEFEMSVATLFKQSDIIIAQQYIPTDFDWRIGVLNGQVIYACKYHMARGHWQIYNHEAKKEKTGGVEAISVYKAPKEVLKTALRASALIGKGLYGVDIKLTDQAAVVIEVNDNPTIDRGDEDGYSGDYLYHIIMEEFLRCLESR